jgi:hypothetical protein
VRSSYALRLKPILTALLEPAMAAVLAECIRGLGAAWGSTGYPVAVVATTAEPDAIPVGVMACFRHEIVLEVGVDFKYCCSGLI